MRNLIYVCATECCVVTLRPEKIPHHRERRVTDEDWRSMKRQWLGLTQTCRQLRLEYRPKYLTATNHRVYMYLRDVEAYTNTFILNYGSDETDALGHITIALGGPGTGPTDLEVKVEMLPLLKLCLGKSVGTSKLKMTFTDDRNIPNLYGPERQGPHQARDLTSILHDFNRKKWRDIVKLYMTRFAINVSPGGLVLYDVLLRREYFDKPDSPGHSFRDILQPKISKLMSKQDEKVHNTWERSLRTRIPGLRDWMNIAIDQEP